MAENNSNVPNQGQPAVAAPAQPAASVKTLDQLTGAEARALVEQAKATGKTVEQVLAEQNGQPAKAEPQRGADGKFQPAAQKPQSNQEAIKEAAAEAKRKLKIDNEEVDEEEVIKTYKARKQHQQEANRKLQDGLTARKQAEEFIAMMRDPSKVQEVMNKLGYTREQLRQMSEQLIAQELENEMLDPREKELRELKAKLKGVEDMERKQQEALEAKRMEEMRNKYKEEFNKQFVAALQESQLPPTKAMVAEMAKHISRAAKIGYKITPQEAAQLVKEDVMIAHQRLIGDSDGEILIKLLGENVANKIRKYDTDRLKSPQQVLSTPKEQAPREERRERGAPKKRMSAAEWREFNRKK